MTKHMISLISEIKTIISARKIPMEYDYSCNEFGMSLEQENLVVRLSFSEPLAVMEMLSDHAILKEIADEFEGIIKKKQYKVTKTKVRLVICLRSYNGKKVMKQEVLSN